MKKWVLVGSLLLLIIIVVVASYILLPKAQAPQKPSNTNPSVSPIASPTQTTFCNPKDLEAKIQMGVAAGNIYGTITLKNASSTPCSIVGNNKLQATSSAKNVTYNYYPAAGQKTIFLAPHQSVYAKVHYPNGPQCQSGIVQSQISFSYPIFTSSTVTFINQNGKTQQGITTCVSEKEQTQVDLWSLSSIPQQ